MITSRLVDRLVTFAVVLLTVLSPSISSAQSAGNQRPEVSIALLIGVSGADVTTIECCGLRTPPSLVQQDDVAALALIGGEGRIYWTPRTSSFVQFERSRVENWHFEYVRQSSAPPFNFYDAEKRLSYRNSSWTVGQSLELAPGSRLRPWIFGAVALRRMTERQQDLTFFDPALPSQSNYKWQRRQLLFTTGTGVRTHVTRSIFVGAELAFAFWGSQDCAECAETITRQKYSTVRVPRFLTFHAATGVLF